MEKDTDRSYGVKHIPPREMFQKFLNRFFETTTIKITMYDGKRVKVPKDVNDYDKGYNEPINILANLEANNLNEKQILFILEKCTEHMKVVVERKEKEDIYIKQQLKEGKIKLTVPVIEPDPNKKKFYWEDNSGERII